MRRLDPGPLRRFLILLGLLAGVRIARAQHEVKIGIAGLFHPQEVMVEALPAEPLQAVSEIGSFSVGSGRRAVFHVGQGHVAAQGTSAKRWTIGARDGSAAEIVVIIPGKLRRVYRGRLSVEAKREEIVAVVTMDREEAVAAIVASEMPASAPLEALKAQAVAARSFLSAGARHRDFDFCDTTHCQFLGPRGGAIRDATLAAAATKGLLLRYQQKPIAALYASRCGGTTHRLSEVGIDAGQGYPYFSVACQWCREHPVKWQSRVASQTNIPAAQSETQRLEAARAMGWKAVPGNSFHVESDGVETILKGDSVGHGVGMCQFGAMGMAREGADFRAILAHYYPDTELVAEP